MSRSSWSRQARSTKIKSICCERIAQALDQLPVRAVLTTGRAVDPDEIEAGPNVEVLQAAPHGRVLREASVVVTHAGHGTVLKSLAAGVPLVCMPTGS